MQSIADSFSKINTSLTSMRFTDVLDIVIVAAFIYFAISLIRRTNSMRFAKGILFIILAFMLAESLSLTMLSFILRKTVELGLIAIVILFQPEFRRLIEKMGSGSIGDIFTRTNSATVIESAIAQTVLACLDMARTRTGALIIFERATYLGEPISTGTKINADVSSELLRNLFFVKAPMHDGAVIIRQGQIVSAGCMLPLSKNAGLSRDLGMRHRAAIGMSEVSDAVCVIVSEESGSISVAVDGMLKRHLSAETFEKLLKNELLPKDENNKKFDFSSITKLLGSKGKKDDGKKEEKTD
ncbi:MAG: TIGR00159 family protein [Ruminococcaceae bacterium]|nr:TIGR00159 family protein [Oscillospiraceae bacterium]